MASQGTRGGLRLHKFHHFESTGLVEHGFTTRLGGVSNGPYAGLNTAFHVGDADENVITNRALASGELNINSHDLIAGKQVHGDRVAVVDRRDLGRGAVSYEDSIPATDALVTGDPGVPLSSYYADCVPLFFLDPVKRIIALAHAGWKGTALKIGRKVVETMAGTFGSEPRHCLAGVGPAIGPCCYEVGEQVMEPFHQSFTDIKDMTGPSSPGKWFLDLWEANRRTLVEAGLKPENIIVSSICTSCRNDLFFSYRAQGGTAGRMASLIVLKEWM